MLVEEVSQQLDILLELPRFTVTLFKTAMGIARIPTITASARTTRPAATVTVEIGPITIKPMTSVRVYSLFVVSCCLSIAVLERAAMPSNIVKIMEGW